jgi:iron complex transport system substrate-binding protein
VKPVLLALLIILLLPLSCSAPSREKAVGRRDSTPEFFDFTDDDDNEISFQNPFVRIIPLYSSHVENLFAIGAGASVIGIARGTDYPPEATALPVFDYNGDPEHIIAAEPDLVIIRPFVRRNSPDYIQKIENAGIPVVSLYCESFEGFDEYILRLGMLSGKLPEAEEKLSSFHRELAEIQKRGEGIQVKKRIFFESTENEVRTVTANSLPARAIEFAGGINAAPLLPPMSAGSSIARFGVEALLGIADNIDVYIVQQGAMNRTSGIEALRARPGFGAIKAVEEGQVLFINEKLISSVSFRYPEGVRILADFLYHD